MKKCLIIADDFTGSNDTGFQLRKRNIETSVCLFPERLEEINGSLVLDTESRNMTEESSYSKVLNDARTILSKSDFDIVYKKVDSTLRGNISSEIEAVSEIYDPEKIVFAPAFPKIGRTTEYGVHYLDGVRILNTEMAQDPYKPVTEDRIDRILERSDCSVVHHDIDELRSGRSSLSDGKCHTFDAKSIEDLDKIVNICIGSQSKILYVGSAGLADSLFNRLFSPLPAVAVVGSVSSVASEQIAFARSQGIDIVKLSPETLLTGKGIDGVLRSIDNVLKKGRDLIVTSCETRSDYDETVGLAESLGLDRKSASRKVQEALGAVSGHIAEEHEISGFFLTGGDTAISVINTLKASGSDIMGEITTGVILSALSGGDHSGLSVITKAGAFGEKDTIVRSLKALREGDLC